MPIPISQLCSRIDELLEPQLFKDYAPNGLQVAGKHNVSNIVSAVTASELAVDVAIEHNADVLLVHHGYFWKGESQCITGIKKNRLKKLLEADINLLAYHLPLDSHKAY